MQNSMQYSLSARNARDKGESDGGTEGEGRAVNARWRRLVLLLVAMSFILDARVAAAETSVQAGWWTSSPVPIAPDAPAGGLVVHGGSEPNQPMAYAAVAFTFDRHDSPVSLTLTTADGTASSPGATLTLCPLTESFAPAEGGSMDKAPKFDCASSVAAAPEADGISYTFDVTKVTTGGRLAVAILPSASTDRVVLARPVADSVKTVSASPNDPSPSSAPSEAAPAPTTSFSDPGLTALPPSLGLPSVSLPDAAASAPGATGDAVASSAPIAVTADEPDATRPALLGLLLGVLCVAAAGFWLAARRAHLAAIPPLSDGARR